MMTFNLFKNSFYFIISLVCLSFRVCRIILKLLMIHGNFIELLSVYIIENMHTFFIQDLAKIDILAKYIYNHRTYCIVRN